MQSIITQTYKAAEDTYIIKLKPVSPISFIPGQFIYVTVPHCETDPKGSTRQMSIASSPSEDNLEIVFREGQSIYKKNLISLSEGEIVEIDGPTGVYPWQSLKVRQHVFLAGGVGIAPFRSRIRYSLEKSDGRKLALYYSNSTLKRAVYHQELINLSSSDTFSFHPTLTQEKSDGINFGRINIKLLKKYGDLSDSIQYWITGLPLMVDDLEEMLLKAGISEDNIFTEKFTGY